MGDVGHRDYSSQLAKSTCRTSWSVLLRIPALENLLIILIGWCSRNSNTVRARTVSAALYNMFCQAAGIIASNIYRQDDKPRYSRGNKQLVAIVSGNVIIYLLVGLYYRWVNWRRDKTWNSWTDEQKIYYVDTTKVEGNKRLDFRFAY